METTKAQKKVEATEVEAWLKIESMEAKAKCLMVALDKAEASKTKAEASKVKAEVHLASEKRNGRQPKQRPMR